MKSYIINQQTFEFNSFALEACGWETRVHKNHIYDWIEYEKRWYVQDLDGSAYWNTVSLRSHENIAFVYVNGQWVGRALKISEANQIVHTIKKNSR